MLLKKSGLEPIPEWADREVWESYKRENGKYRGNILYRTLTKTLPVQHWFFGAEKMDWDQTEQMIVELGKNVKKVYAPDVLFGIDKGGSLYVRRLARELDIDPHDPERVARMKITHYRDLLGTNPLTQPIAMVFYKARVEEEPAINPSGKRILLVDSDVATGKTLQSGKGFVMGHGAENAKSATLYGNMGMNGLVRKIAFRNNEPDFFASQKAYGIYPWYQI
jgi:hypoxanthine phosphoribosyltransferase